jgi:hypothetical protein
MAVIPALKRQRKESLVFEACLGLRLTLGRLPSQKARKKNPC